VLFRSGSHCLHGDMLQGERGQEVCTIELALGPLQEEMTSWSGGGGVVVLLPITLR
jgi:hypothetical protein